MRTILLILSLCSCETKDDGDDDTGGAAASNGLPDGMGGLAALSSGECPDMTVSGTSTFFSSDEERTVTMVVPDSVTDDMPLVFFFHGLLDPGSMPDPTGYMAQGLQLQSIANDEGVIFILPESPVMTVMGFQFFMWTVDQIDSPDIVLFDDLRTCASDQLGVDLTRLHAMGFSGGAIFTTVVARDRGDTLATMIEMSGGADITMPTFDTPLAQYDTPPYTMPALLITGGSTDVWPDQSLTLVDFSTSTDALQANLVDDGHFVVRCEHNQGHTATSEAINTSWEWVDAHQFGETSPFIDEGIDVLGDWCVVVD